MRMVVGLVLWAACAGAADVSGSHIFAERCAACHGATGRGDGPTAEYLSPAPRDFHDRAFWQGRTLEQVTEVIRKGRNGTGMPQFQGVLSDAEIDAVAHHVQSFAGHTPGAGASPGTRPGQDAPRP